MTNPYIYGLHDAGGEHNLRFGQEARGWVVITEAIGRDPNDTRGGNYQWLVEQGFGVIVRLNHDYGPNGTIPHPRYYTDFAQRVANFVRGSQGCQRWIIGNEMNFEIEQPRQQAASASPPPPPRYPTFQGEPVVPTPRYPNLPTIASPAEPITPRLYATCYQQCRQAIRALPGHTEDEVLTGAIAPWNIQTPYPADPNGDYPANPSGDWVHYLRDMLTTIGPNNCDGIALHAYTHGYDANLIYNTAKMDPPYQAYHYHFYTYRDQMAGIPTNMRQLPIYITEANGDKEPNGATWPFGNNGWVKNCYQEINWWNENHTQQIYCVTLFRWIIDPLGWSIDGKPGVQEDLRQAVARGYRYQPRLTPPSYQVDYVPLSPLTLSMAQPQTVKLTLTNRSNVGLDSSFRLSYRWFTIDGQPLPDSLWQANPTALPDTVASETTVTVSATVYAPRGLGQFELRWDLLNGEGAPLSDQGVDQLLVSVTVRTRG